LHSASDVSHLESKNVILENMLKGLSPQMPQISQTSTVSCSHCQALDHSLSACPYFAHQLGTGQEQASMAFQKPKNDPFSPYYNPGWRNHPNFSWSNRPNAAIPNSQPISHPPNSFHWPIVSGVPNASRPPPPIAQALSSPDYTDIDRMKRRINSNVERMVSANMKKMMRMITEQFSQLASSSRESGTFRSQPEVNTKLHTSSSSGADPSEFVRKVNATISLQSGREIDDQVRNPNEPWMFPHQFFQNSSSSSSSCPSSSSSSLETGSSSKSEDTTDSVFNDSDTPPSFKSPSKKE